MSSKPSKIRAFSAIAAPILGWGYGFFVFISKGYSLIDYPIMIFSGELSWLPQALALIATAAWVALYWPSAFTIAQHGNLVIVDNESITLLQNDITIRKSDIEHVEFRDLFFTKKLCFKMKNGSEHKITAIFFEGALQGDGSDIVESISRGIT